MKGRTLLFIYRNTLTPRPTSCWITNSRLRHLPPGNYSRPFSWAVIGNMGSAFSPGERTSGAFPGPLKCGCVTSAMSQDYSRPRPLPQGNYPRSFPDSSWGNVGSALSSGERASDAFPGSPRCPQSRNSRGLTLIPGWPPRWRDDVILPVGGHAWFTRRCLWRHFR